MNLLDLRTIFFSYTISNLVCAFMLFNLWIQNRHRYSGLGFWLADFGLNFIGLFAITLRGVIPDFFSVLIGSVFLVLGNLFLYVGVNQFFGKKLKVTSILLPLIIYAVLQAIFVFYYPSLSIRNILFSLAVLIICLRIALMLFQQKNEKTIRQLGYIFVTFSIISLFRIGVEIITPSGNDLLESGFLETLILFTYQMIYIVLTFFLFLMVNRRLVNDLESDITIRKVTEDELQNSQEKFQKAFQTSPNSVLISRASDGKLIEVNEKFVALSGYTREEILANSTLSLNMWVDTQDRKKVVELLKKNGSVQDYEFDGRIKSEKIRKFLYSGSIININNEDCIISNLTDITERKQNEFIIRLRLMLWEYSADHTTIELMQKTLDEIEELTGSQIGFFHLFDAEKNDLILQAWSTRTKEKFCKAEGEGMHYSLDKAGVWGDGVRLKKPIIHNDYASLLNKKGMPEGHAKVIRELVVPIMRNKQVAAILGIGNKVSDYDEEDVALVYNVANVVWPIILENQAEEEITILNSKLENLAMTDELTRLSNRRAFFIRGKEEILRSKRYRSPLAMIMLDIDKFKNINDSLGHEYGDLALQCIAKILKERLREVDMVGRLGGEEFGILLPNTCAEEAVILAERLRLAIIEKSCVKNDQKVSMTASFGIAELSEEMTNLDDLLRSADAAMYQAKNEGRNRVIKFSKNMNE